MAQPVAFNAWAAFSGPEKKKAHRVAGIRLRKVGVRLRRAFLPFNEAVSRRLRKSQEVSGVKWCQNVVPVR